MEKSANAPERGIGASIYGETTGRTRDALPRRIPGGPVDYTSPVPP